MLETFGHLPVSDSVAIANGAVPLEEEESDNLSIGFVVDMGDVFSVTVDYFQIDIDGRITLVQGTTGNVRYFTSPVDAETDGFDINARGTFDTLRFLSDAYHASDEAPTRPPDTCGCQPTGQGPHRGRDSSLAPSESPMQIG